MFHERRMRTVMRFVQRVLGRWIQPAQLTPSEPTAYHEAGHAVAAVALGIGLVRVSVVGSQSISGRIEFGQPWPHIRLGFNPLDPRVRRIAEDWLLVALVGGIEDDERSFRSPDLSDFGRLSDSHQANELASCLVEPLQRDALLQEAERRAREFVKDPLRKRQISAVAARLVHLKELDGQQVRQIMDEIAAAGDPRELDRRS
jgi:hypothetical protein